jgi:hypothetical protein
MWDRIRVHQVDMKTRQALVFSVNESRRSGFLRHLNGAKQEKMAKLYSIKPGDARQEGPFKLILR